MDGKITVGLACMQAEAGEKRDFLPAFAGWLETCGAQVVLDSEIGSKLGLSHQDYLAAAPGAVFAGHAEVYRQDYVLALRCPEPAELKLLRQGACLVSMLHYPTRPERVAMLRSLGIEAISLDSLKDDSGRRVVENLRAVAWNGLEAAFRALREVYPAPGFDSPQRGALHVTQLGSGAVGMHVMQAAIRYGDAALWQELARRGVPGVQLTVVDYDTTAHPGLIAPLLAKTDLLVDATQRIDPSQPVLVNDQVGLLPAHAVIVDLSVDPYECSGSLFVKGIEGIPQGNLDQYVFAPDDPAFDAIPDCFHSEHRRWSVSCYSWPGIHPVECMQTYGDQLRPVFRKILEKGGVARIDPNGTFFERAIARAQLSRLG